MDRISWLKKIEEDAKSCIGDMARLCHKVNWVDSWTYACWLAQSFFYVRHATRVLALAAARCKLDQESLHRKFLQGIDEEKNHELLALRDLKHIGYEIDEFLEWPETSAYYQTLYCNIETDGPYALLGYFLPLEGLAAIGLKEICETVLAHYGDRGGSFIKMHCKIDAGHFEEGLEFLRELPEGALPFIHKNMWASSKLYMNLTTAVVKAATREEKKPA